MQPVGLGVIAMSDTNPPADLPRCKHLCCKSMLVYGEAFESDPEYQDGQTDFWCMLTFKPIGPDGEGAAMDTCRDPQRACYREY
jgi:hypothetical protein